MQTIIHPSIVGFTLVVGLGLGLACADDAIIEAGSNTGTEGTGDGDGDGEGSETSTTESMSGDGDGDPATGDGDGDGDMSGDGDGDMTGDGDGDGDPTGDGDGDMTGDGDGDMTGDGDGDPNPDTCGDGIVDDGEDCDDQNEDNNDGCLSNCTIATSCLDVIEVDPDAEDGMYVISPKPDSPWMAQCDMTTDGGGWTGLILEHTCNGNLDSNVVEVDDANTFDIDDACRPFTRDGGAGHTYYWNIEFPPGFEAIYLSNYWLRSNAGGVAASEIDGNQFIQSDWNDGNGNDHGDVSFGSADEPGPVTSFADTGTDIECESCEEQFGSPDTPFDLAAPTSTLRIGWGENGIQAEGWYPWWSGTIFVR